ncbi:MAG: choice-of-anchor I domain-containing protein [Oscillospiraceae bacterium]
MLLADFTFLPTKGPEPENVTVGTVNGRTYAFAGLERIGGVMICDITDPSSVAFRNYVNSRNYSADIYDDVSPEGVIFVAAEQNISGAPLVIASNEVSGTVSVTALDMDAPAEDDPRPAAASQGRAVSALRGCAESG